MARDVIGAFWQIFEVFEWEDIEITETRNTGLFITRANSRARTLSGLEYVNSYVLLIRIANGKVARHTEYFDPILAAELMGSGES